MILTVEAPFDRKSYVMKGNEVSWVLRSQDPGLIPPCHMEQRQATKYYGHGLEGQRHLCFIQACLVPAV